MDLKSMEGFLHGAMKLLLFFFLSWKTYLHFLKRDYSKHACHIREALLYFSLKLLILLHKWLESGTSWVFQLFSIFLNGHMFLYLKYLCFETGWLSAYLRITPLFELEGTLRGPLVQLHACKLCCYLKYI